MKQDSVALDHLHDESPGRIRLDRVLAGLRATPKQIEPIWFYDARGSGLFERICDTPEYYPTRTELGILRANAPQMATALGPQVALIEPGSGASLKTRLLLEALESPRCYVPVDISREHLLATARRLRDDYPSLTVQPVCADFTRSFTIPEMALRGATRRVVYFPGSSIGNFSRANAIELLGRWRQIVGPDGAIVLGIDRVKPAPILERAYDDAAGITAEFNRNALLHLNRELGASFDPTAFEHRAPWVPAHQRIEMHLVASRDLSFAVGGESFAMAQGEYLLTEFAHKYTLSDAADVARSAGLAIRNTWSDARDWFSVLLLEPA
jgi:dimethylhistidine N-methyltransferase